MQNSRKNPTLSWRIGEEASTMKISVLYQIIFTFLIDLLKFVVNRSFGEDHTSVYDGNGTQCGANQLQ